MASHTFVIEHMEEDDEESKAVPPWVYLEYRQMIAIAGATSSVLFTHLSSSSRTALNSALESVPNSSKFEVHSLGILDVMKQHGVDLNQVCLLDPKAEKELSPSDGDNFSWFLFGGILGDDPPRDRTSELRRLGFPNRHLGSVQMTTDTALGVTKRVVVDKVPLQDLPYVDHPTIRFNAKESVEMPFRYITDSKGEPILPEGMKALLKMKCYMSFSAPILSFILSPYLVQLGHVLTHYLSRARLCADFIAKEIASSKFQRPLFAGFQGPQGSGKTTLTNQIKTILGTLPTPIHTIVFSIDDLYLPYDGLIQLGRTHPDNALLQGRGLPGSHDPVLGATILERLSRINAGDDTSISLPVFDKSAYQGFGDRSSETVEVWAPVDVVILEGWCFGFQPLSPAELEKRYSEPGAEGGADENSPSHQYFKSHSIKSLEAINGSLKNYADLWYRYFTHFIQASMRGCLVRNLYDVFEWRLQQEHAMKLKNGGRGMTDEEVHSFVARYMPGYELFQDTIESPNNPWIGHGLKVVLDKQRAVVRTQQF
ncbi:hypothetical protein RHS01_07871 [Rhizoctonia solani]|uniref:Uncharacterized protein n=1 Tax=Rhizoctonia solani TaxID=456999 RepID=A0A8H7I807_9AGAM|nr:hypothetical protein RHS01_07871 [Rhizoctonia solani]